VAISGGLPDARIGAVHLTVTDLVRALGFYRDVVGLAVRPEDGAVALAAPGGEVLVRLTERRDLRAPSQGPGLFHFALLVPSRAELARALAGLEAARWPLHGASDHGVSEALYLADPDGHGIEIYADRPRETWRRVGGEIVMVTEPLDREALLAEPDDARVPWSGLPPGTVMGHVHLRVRDLDEAERFFAGELGLAVTVRNYPGARFFAAGGYHHHVGVNTWWRGRGPESGVGRVGLESFELLVPGAPSETRLPVPDGAYSVIVHPL
jgi:catechol 2,3-dioxygenase